MPVGPTDSGPRQDNRCRNPPHGQTTPGNVGHSGECRHSMTKTGTARRLDDRVRNWLGPCFRFGCRDCHRLHEQYGSAGRVSRCHDGSRPLAKPGPLGRQEEANCGFESRDSTSGNNCQPGLASYGCFFLVQAAGKQHLAHRLAHCMATAAPYMQGWAMFARTLVRSRSFQGIGRITIDAYFLLEALERVSFNEHVLRVGRSRHGTANGAHLGSSCG